MRKETGKSISHFQDTRGDAKRRTPREVIEETKMVAKIIGTTSSIMFTENGVKVHISKPLKTTDSIVEPAMILPETTKRPKKIKRKPNQKPMKENRKREANNRSRLNNQWYKGWFYINGQPAESKEENKGKKKNGRKRR